mmetsp:Transcript_158625/g.504849  ORF Transcript_158625/g.504849 Transcript_158625/m.504849 type:complete len:256 (-) Transcript_158625:127-894(-)
MGHNLGSGCRCGGGTSPTNAPEGQGHKQHALLWKVVSARLRRRPGSLALLALSTRRSGGSAPTQGCGKAPRSATFEKREARPPLRPPLPVGGPISWPAFLSRSSASCSPKSSAKALVQGRASKCACSPYTSAGTQVNSIKRTRRFSSTKTSCVMTRKEPSGSRLPAFSASVASEASQGQGEAEAAKASMAMLFTVSMKTDFIQSTGLGRPLRASSERTKASNSEPLRRMTSCSAALSRTLPGYCVKSGVSKTCSS